MDQKLVTDLKSHLGKIVFQIGLLSVLLDMF